MQSRVSTSPETSPSSETRKASCAVTKAVLMDAIQIQNTQEHVGTPLHVVRKDNVTIPFERSVDSADELNRHFLMRVAMGITHVGSLINQHVIENRAVAVRSVAQLLDKLRHVLDVIPIDLCILINVFRLIAVVGRSMPDAGEAGFREALTRQVATQH